MLKPSPEELEAWKKEVGWSDTHYGMWKALVKHWALYHEISYESALSIIFNDTGSVTMKDLCWSKSSYYAEYDIAGYGEAESPTVARQNDSSGA